MPSPFVTVQDGAGAPQATTNGANVTPGNTVTVALVSNAGVNTWALLCVYSDEQNVPATVNAGLSVNALTKIATFPAPAIGSALIFQSQINQGQNAQFQNDPTLTTTFGVFALTSGGFRVAALNETYEGNGTYGWIAKLNAIFRAGSIAVTWANDLLGSSSSSQTVVKLSSASAIPVTTALSFGTNPAGTGALRLANALAIKGRNQANALDMSLLATNSSNQVLLGDIGFASVLQGLSIAGVVGGTTLLSLAGASGDFLKLGAPTATGSAYSSAGLLRIGDVNGTAITILSGRNATNTADQTLISSDGSGNVFYDGGSAQTFLRGNISATIGIPGSYNLSIANNGQISTYGGAGFRVTNNASGFIFNSDSSLPNWTFQINAASILSMGALGSGTNVLQLFDGTAPTSAPSGSSYLYSTSGVLKYRGSSGKIWTIGRSVRTSATSTTFTTADDIVALTASGQTLSLPPTPSTNDKFTAAATFTLSSGTSYAVSGNGNNICYAGTNLNTTVTISGSASPTEALQPAAISFVWGGSSWIGAIGL